MTTKRTTSLPLAAGLALSAITQAVLAQAVTPAPSAPAVVPAPESAASSPESSVAPAAAAPAAKRAAPSTQLDAVVIVANKREERLQEVPASAAVVQPQQLDQQRVVSVEDLQRAVPTMQGSGNGLSIRGYGATSFSPTAEGAVGVVVDGVSMGGSSETPPNLFDVERVEVLEGSQGTLFGKNASAGVVNIVTVAPNMKSFGGVARIEGRTRSSGGAQFALNVPASEQLAFRISGGLVQDPRVVHNIPDDSWDGTQRQNARARMRWLPTTDVRVDLSVDNSVNKIKGGTPTVFYKTTPGSPLTAALAACGVTVGEENTQGCASEGYKRKDESRGASGQVDWFLGDYTLTSITAIRRASTETTSNELDGINVPVPSATQAPLFKDFKNTSQEFRVASPDFEAGNFVLGAFYYNQDIDGGSERKIVVPPGLTLGDTKQQTGSTRSLALFGQGLYRATQDLSFTLGARLGHERVSTTASGALLPGAIAPVIAANLNPVNAELTDTYYSYKTGAQYQLTKDNMVYALYTRGYKGPAINDVIPSPDTPVIVQPEIPKTWELGLKNQFLNGRVGLNFTAYHTKAENYQTTVLDPITLSFVSGNAPSATFKGGSVSFYGRVTPDLMLNGGLSRMTTETERASIGATGSEPTIRATLAATYGFWVSDFRASVGTDVTYEDRPADDPSAPLSWAHKATIVGAQAGFRSPDGNWGLTLNVRNLFNKFDPAGRSGYFLGQFVGDTGAAFQTFKPESLRVIGLTLDAKF
ncbi:TonB-dependent receptor [Piscinibacter gummiphilus]|uniref:TonB-dependent receptor n=1 Tax=Piscinibacter gummiphilus TaxID=946333 RepID=UPI0012FDBA8C|nr:TonB-dependent receptor [Piscinibacter gummiphilus]